MFMKFQNKANSLRFVYFVCCKLVLMLPVTGLNTLITSYYYYYYRYY